jgi:hypothetical protein
MAENNKAILAKANAAITSGNYEAFLAYLHRRHGVDLCE